MTGCLLSSRGVLEVAGDDAATFLNAVSSCPVTRIEPGGAGFGALLTPQGKIVADFILFKQAETLCFLDVSLSALPELVKRLTMYRLRAKITVTDVSNLLAVFVGGETDAVPAAPDPRLAALGLRGLAHVGQIAADSAAEDAYHAGRVRNGVPEGGRDFLWNDVFPHEVMMDLLNGLDFTKGCYIGQEVVSRMQHKTVVRTRTFTIRCGSPAPWTRGEPVMAGEKTIGTAGDGRNGEAVALLRLDMLEAAHRGGIPVTLRAAPVTLVLQPWIPFGVAYEPVIMGGTP
ncbi:MAG: folate-binding protein [Methylobacteriaceae bacterium]|jgi:folate-binding protein YgfZ|nr:folate-binding protein [Methylobacteriaceae bacterium]